MKKDIIKIQEYLKNNCIDAFVVFTNDDHGSEYVVDYYKFRAFLSGFTGSAGTLVITQDGSYLWTDGRYFLQASEQLKTTDTKLMKMGEQGVPSIYEFIASLGDNPTVSFDYRIATVSFVNGLIKAVPNVKLINNESMTDIIWTDRPKMRNSIAWSLTEKQAGESFSSKIKGFRDSLAKEKCQCALIASLDDIAWLFNLRGDDIKYNPVNYAYAIVDSNNATLYISEDKINEKVRKYLVDNQIETKDYFDVYKDIKNISGTILIDKTKTNYALYNLCENKKETDRFPTTIKKTIKNKTEIANIKKAHIEDAVAMVKFMKYIKTRVGKEKITEISAADKLESFRREGKHFLDLSFDTICGYGSHGAIIHYSATEDTSVDINTGNLLLVDSGAQYTTGTTDITRTYALGKISKEMKRNYTLVLKSHIAVARAKFIKGTTGYAIDMLAREPLYEYKLDFRHGTGHGVGYILNVHEGPQRIALRAANWETLYPMQPGMVTSNEPGLYFDGQYGIRHENLVLCVEDGKSEYGDFYKFETLTFVPFDLDAIDVALLTNIEKKWLNDYHKEVYKKVSPYLEDSDKKYLLKVTREI